MRVLIIFFLLLMVSPIRSATLSDLIADLRQKTGEPDTSQSIYSDSTAKGWINAAQDKVVTLAGFIEKQFDAIYSVADTFGVVLPSDFKRAEGATVWVGYQWEPMKRDPYFISEASGFLFDVRWQDKDTALAYFRGNDLHQGVQIRLTYKGTADELLDGDSTCQVPDDLQTFITDEAIVYYLCAQKQYQAGLTWQQAIRKDMGVVEQVSQ